MRRIFTIIFALVVINGFSQVNFTRISLFNEDDISITIYRIDENININDNGGYGFKFAAPVEYTSFAIGWNGQTNNLLTSEFDVEYKVHKPKYGWSKWKTDEGFVNPEDTQNDFYQSDLLFGTDEYTHDSIEFYVYCPQGEQITELYLILLDVSKTINPDIDMSTGTNPNPSRACPQLPYIIPRSAWCGSYSACLNASYTPTYITTNVTHTVIHHGASPTSYTDGYAVVRSYWNYHVNTNGWSDIGYNYLVDKYGNLFQGRYNPNSPNSDVRAAHAGSSNSYSIGINFLGNSDAVNTAPTTPQLQKCSEFLAWWYDYKGFDPTSSASILNQAGPVWVTLPRICGHRDVNPGGTTCPGNALYALLSDIKTDTKQIILDCSAPSDTEAPTTLISTDRNWYNSKFETHFADADNVGGTGVKYSFYQIMDYDGTEWRANGNNGFFNDNFSNGINTEWTDVSGNWSVNAGQLLQTDEITENSNIYANLTQESGEIYLYHWGLKILGESQTRRAGIHFFCSEPTGEGRGNSYLVYLRADDNSIQICRYYDNLYDSPNSWHTFTDFTINTDQFYDVKVILNTISGEISVYINDVIAASEIDPTPLTSGSAISLRTGTSQAVYDNIKVYKARENIIDVIPGLSPNADIRYQSSTASEEAGRIRTVLVNNSNNWSESVSENIFTDFDVPITTIATENNNDWQTADFVTNFTDTDELSGIEKSMYCVSDFDGSKWTANPEKGFVYNDFDTEIGTEWISQVGTWTHANGNLVQTDEAEGNTNIYSYIQHELSNRHLYEFDLKIDGTDTDKRAGFHFFADDPTLTNRGNGYFIWFRLITQQLEFYKVENDVFSLEKSFDIEFNENQWYSIKLIFDRINGDTFAYMDDMLVGEYKDAAPYFGGNYISFRSGNSIMSIDNLRVYRSRYSNLGSDVSVGNSLADIRYESVSPENEAARIYSIVHDSAKNISSIATYTQKVDWTPPPAIATVNDGIGSDINYTSVFGEISANWTAVSDENSGILAYYYAVGTSPGATDFIPWTNNGTNLNFTDLSVTLILGTTYYVSVKAENGAGLFSELTTSDGCLATLSVECPEDYSVCINDNPVTLEGSSPVGGVYSGLGVTDGIFNPQTANEGTHTITYTYQTEICQFNITVNESPVVLCPEDIIVTEADSPVALQGGTPEGGEYSIDGVPVSYINPANYDFEEYEIVYSYTDETSTCSAYCVYHLTVTPFVNTAIFEQSNFAIYPNPNNGDFTLIIANNQKDIIAEIFNLQGQVLYSTKIYPNTDKVEFSGLNMSAGIYLLKLSSDKHLNIEKIIIK
ncbi:MAG: N-acetylmuramoyl-L-alanine amidase [Bacteroidales bacterium]|nr:N-acetylmuramoyl-L-alanine amidase [Bacteroidales bacterium]